MHHGAPGKPTERRPVSTTHRERGAWGAFGSTAEAQRALAEGRIDSLGLADYYDGLIAEALGNAATVSVLALGGYGRRELSPFSDVDVQFLVEAGDADAEAAIQTCLHRLWDAGLKLGYATRCHDETLALAADDLKTAMALLEARRIVGPPEPFERLVAALTADVYAPKATALLSAIVDERANRHSRLADSVFLLEPDIKLGQGGLRDIHGARWAARLCGVTTGQGEPALSGLGITREEADALERAHAELTRFRAALHRATGRRGDRLFFAHQEAVAAGVGERDVAAAMQRFWRAAAKARSLTRRVLDHLVVETGGTAGPWLLVPEPVEPEGLVAIFRRAGETGLPIHPNTLRAVAAAIPRVNEATRTEPTTIDDFFAVLTMPDDGRALMEMHDIGLLGAIVPEFRAVTGRYQRNVFHLYTVDVHSLRGIVELKRLRSAQGAEADVMMRLDRRDLRVLFLAVLLHDIDKAGLDPAVAGVVASRLRLTDADAALVEQLVRGHLTLALLAQMRDVHDPATQHHLARDVGDRRALAILYLVTHADMSSTNPAFFTAWKRGLLHDLFRLTDARLTEGLDVWADEGHVARERRRQVFALVGADADHPDGRTRDVDAFLGQLPTRYFAETPADVVVEHFAMQSGARPAVRRRSAGPLIWYSVVCDDAPGLLYRLSGIFASRGVSLVRAEAFRTADGTAIVELAVSSEPRDAGAVELELRAVAALAATSGDGVAEGRLRERERPSAYETAAPLPGVTVSHDADASSRFSVIDVVAPDRAGLLYKAARAIHHLGLSLELACVSAEGREARQAFYVQRAGEKLGPADAQAVVAAIRQAVAAPV